jgi:serine/threonine-protein kinase
MVEICSHHLHTPPEPPSKRTGSAVSEDLEQLLLACLAKDADDRPQSARELQTRLSACGDAGSWDVEQAEQWWADNGAAVHPSHRTLDTSGYGRTLAVDLIHGR